MGGSGNMVAVQQALHISEADMAYALVIDSIDYSLWVMFLLWAISFAPQFNKWTKASTATLDEVCARLEKEMQEEDKHMNFPGLLFLIGGSLLVSALSQNAGNAIFEWTKTLIGGNTPWIDSATWTVLVVTIIALVAAVTPIGKIAGAAELSNVMLYIVIALLASRASLLELTDAPVWIISGFMILAIHGIILVVIAKIFKLDMFTCGVASLANIGGTASAPVLAASYSGALVPVGVLMALMGYIIGTGGGILTANIMRLFA